MGGGMNQGRPGATRSLMCKPRARSIDRAFGGTAFPYIGPIIPDTVRFHLGRQFISFEAKAGGKLATPHPE